jgi:ADP-heptose:LPS heptosyltransferase
MRVGNAWLIGSNSGAQGIRGKIPTLLPRKLLLVVNEKLGDLCLALPIFEAFRDLSPQTRIVCVCGPDLVGLVADQPNVDEVWGAPRRIVGREFRQYIAKIRRFRPDLAIITRHQTRRWERAALIAGIPARIGSSSLWTNTLTKNVYSPTFEWSVRHEARKGLDLVALALGLEVKDYCARVVFSEPRQREIDLRLESLDLPERFYVIQLGNGGSSRLFLPSFFANVATELKREFGLTPVLTGVQREAILERQFAEAYPFEFCSVMGKTNLVELCGVLSQATFVLSADTGTPHLAACFGVPSVVLMPMHQFHPEQWSPWKANSIVVRPRKFCNGCTERQCLVKNSDCVLTISESAVIQSCRTMLSEIGIASQETSSAGSISFANPT